MFFFLCFSFTLDNFCRTVYVVRAILGKFSIIFGGWRFKDYFNTSYWSFEMCSKEDTKHMNNIQIEIDEKICLIRREKMSMQRSKLLSLFLFDMEKGITRTCQKMVCSIKSLAIASNVNGKLIFHLMYVACETPWFCILLLHCIALCTVFFLVPSIVAYFVMCIKSLLL